MRFQRIRCSASITIVRASANELRHGDLVVGHDDVQGRSCCAQDVVRGHRGTSAGRVVVCQGLSWTSQPCHDRTAEGSLPQQSSRPGHGPLTVNGKPQRPPLRSLPIGLLLRPRRHRYPAPSRRWLLGSALSAMLAVESSLFQRTPMHCWRRAPGVTAVGWGVQGTPCRSAGARRHGFRRIHCPLPTTSGDARM